MKTVPDNQRNRIKKCHAHAEECRAKADLAPHSNIEQAFMEAAEQWETLAREIGEIEKTSEFTMRRARFVMRHER